MAELPHSDYPYLLSVQIPKLRSLEQVVFARGGHAKMRINGYIDPWKMPELGT
jgi:hypothetical protein